MEISPNFKPKLTHGVLEDEPVSVAITSAVSSALHNGSRGVLECFAMDAGYTINDVNFNVSYDIMGMAEMADLYDNLGMV